MSYDSVAKIVVSLIVASFVTFAPVSASAARKCGGIPPDNPLPAALETLVRGVADIIKAKSTWDAVGSYAELAAHLADIADSDDSRKKELKELEDHLVALFSVSFHQAIDFEIDHGLSALNTALDEALRFTSGGSGLPEGSPADYGAETAVRNAYSNDALSKRIYDECANEGRTRWKDLIPPPARNGDGSAYEWRFSVPYLMTAIALRLQVIEAMDPRYRIDGRYDKELRDHANALEGQLRRMRDGVRCHARRGDGDVHNYAQKDLHIACADINTGLAVRTDIKDGSRTSDAWISEIEARYTSQLIAQMPLFEMQGLIDTLHFYLKHSPELTEAGPHIRVAAAPTLCLDVQWANPAPGTPVWLWYCNGTAAQQWRYDRARSQVRNTALDTCLEVQRYVGHVEGYPIPGTPVVSRKCDDSLYQQWTYNPETQVLTNAFGTVLDIEWGHLSAGTPVWVWTRNDTAAQRWKGDARFVVPSSLPPSVLY